MAVQKDETAVHPLLTREIQLIFNWREWLACWQKADNLQTMEGLLHVGFNVWLEPRYSNQSEKKHDAIDRIIFYFTIADGWVDEGLFRLESDDLNLEYPTSYDECGKLIRKTPSQLRQQLARKAFDMLGLNFFKTKPKEASERGFNNVWEDMVVSEKLLPVIQNFFRIEKTGYKDEVRLRNFFHYRQVDKRTYSEELAVGFLLNLANFLWERKEPDVTGWYDVNEEKKNERLTLITATSARIEAAKPWMIEVLSELNQLDVLRRWILKLGDPCLAKLTEIALRSKLDQYKHPVAKDRPVVNLEEARYAGSKAAWLLKEYKLCLVEDTRLKALLQAETDQAKALRMINMLSGKK